MSKTISYAFFLVFKIVKNLQCILKYNPMYCKFNETDMVLFHVFNDIFRISSAILVENLKNVPIFEFYHGLGNTI